MHEHHRGEYMVGSSRHIIEFKMSFQLVGNLNVKTALGIHHLFLTLLPSVINVTGLQILGEMIFPVVSLG